LGGKKLRRSMPSSGAPEGGGGATLDSRGSVTRRKGVCRHASARSAKRDAHDSPRREGAQGSLLLLQGALHFYLPKSGRKKTVRKRTNQRILESGQPGGKKLLIG